MCWICIQKVLGPAKVCKNGVQNNFLLVFILLFDFSMKDSDFLDSHNVRKFNFSDLFDKHVLFSFLPGLQFDCF